MDDITIYACKPNALSKRVEIWRKYIYKHINITGITRTDFRVISISKNEIDKKHMKFFKKLFGVADSTHDRMLKKGFYLSPDFNYNFINAQYFFGTSNNIKELKKDKNKIVDTILLNGKKMEELTDKYILSYLYPKSRLINKKHIYSSDLGIDSLFIDIKNKRLILS